jgi:hypothetical protein
MITKTSGVLYEAVLAFNMYTYSDNFNLQYHSTMTKYKYCIAI